MQTVFIERARDTEAVAYFDNEANLWYFNHNHRTFLTVEALLYYLAEKRTHATRQLPSVGDLRTYQMYQGNLRVIPWSQFLIEEARITEQLISMYGDINDDDGDDAPQCFCCCQTFIATESLEDFDATQNQIHEDVLIESPCRDPAHAICVICLRRIVLNFYNHPASQNKPYLGCLFDECPNGDGAMFQLKSFENILTIPEFNQLESYMEKVQIPESLHVACAACQNIISRPMLKKFINSQDVSLTCVDCNLEMCWHCSCPFDNCVCSFVLPTYSGGFNQFLRPIGVRNCNIDTAIIQNNVMSIVSNPTKNLIMACPKCGVCVEKSILCNEMSHCNVKWCFLCGKTCLQNETILFDHFNWGSGDGCPRYESIEFWKSKGATSYQCQEGQCYDDTKSCTSTCQYHKYGRTSKNIVHRVMWLWHLFHNLSKKWQNHVISLLRNIIPRRNPVVSLFLNHHVTRV